jgi:hypothetical protein
MEPMKPLGEEREVGDEELAVAAKRKGGGNKISPNLEPIVLEMMRDGYSTTAISNRLADEHKLNVHPATVRTFLRRHREIRAQAVEEAIAQAVAKDATADLTRLAKVTAQLEEAMEFHYVRPRFWIKLVEQYRKVLDTKLRFTIRGTPLPAEEAAQVEQDLKSVLEAKLDSLPVTPAPANEDDDDPDDDTGDPDDAA